MADHLRPVRRAHLRCSDGCGRTFVVPEAELQVGEGVRCPWCRRITPADRIERLERQVARGPSVRYGVEMLNLGRAASGLLPVGTVEHGKHVPQDPNDGGPD